MSTATFDKQDQYDRIVEGLLQGEQVIAVYDATGAGTGFIGVTNLRVVIQDNSLTGKKSALTSLHYGRVDAVSFISDKSMFGKVASSSEIAIRAGGVTYEVEFRGADKAKHVHDAVLAHLLQRH